MLGKFCSRTNSVPSEERGLFAAERRVGKSSRPTVLRSRPRIQITAIRERLSILIRKYFEAFWTMIWDAKGNYWKEQFAFRSPVKLTDGQPILSVGTVVIINVQNGRITLVTLSGLQPRLSTKPLYPCDASDGDAGRCHPMNGCMGKLA